MTNLPPAHGSDDQGDPLGVARAAVVTLDGRKRVTGWSPQAERLLGYPAEEVLGRPIDGLSARGHEGHEAWSSAQPDGETPVQTVFRHRSGHFLHTVTSLHRLPATAGTPYLLLLADAAEHAQWQLQQAMLHGLAAESSIALTIYGPDLRVAWANAAARQELPGQFTQYVGRSEDDLYPGSQVLSSGYPSSVTQLMGEVLASGESVVDLRYRGRTLVDPEREHVWSLSYYRLQDATGRALGVCEESVDVTDLHRAQYRLTLLNKAAAVIGSTFDLDRTVQEFAEILVPSLADFIAVDLLGSVMDGREPDTRSAAWTGDMRRAFHRSVREDLPEVVVPPGGVVGYAEGSPQWQCLAGGRPVLNAVLAPSSPWLAEDRVRRTRMRDLGIHSHMVVPLRARHVTMGVATLMRWRNPDPFTAEDLLLVEEVAARAAVCVDNARRFTRERHSTLMLQRSLLPREMPAHAAVEAAYRYLPADAETGMGGDWFDVLPLACARVGLVVGDVVGHGLGAAATMGRLRTAVHTLADLDLPPDELLAHLDDLVQRLAEEAGTARPFGAEGAVGATCLYGIYDSVTRRATFASAGHPPPVLAHRDKPVEFCDIPSGPPLGVGGTPFEAVEFEVPDDCVLALYTDGLITASESDLDVGQARLSFALAHPDRPLEEIAGTLERILLPERPPDDVAFLVARPRPLPTDSVVSWSLAFELETVGRARALTSDCLAQWGLEDYAFSAELIVSELVTNAIRHARSPVSLRLIRTENRLICAVSDGSSTSPHMRRAKDGEEGGRGLFLVAQFAARWGTRHTMDGKIIWAELVVPGEEANEPLS
ncbi:SpoIIE family protein phosphatase [Streptomyces sp. NPDC014802]|uniref:ATP-binding SpoIIE family protein phosphatase n=1 Tax=Streptomyces sp. NPDC014802 TaxID=3364917 RepID=UPI00370144BC